MRCDVCDTKIPPGADRCPNCGYRVRHSSTATHTQATSANYPEPEVFKPKRNKKIYIPRREKTRDRSQRTKAFTFRKYIIFIVALIAVVQMASVFIGNIVSNYNSHNYTEFSGESLQEGIDNGDDDGTLQLALDYENDLKSFFSDDLLMDVDVSESYDIYEDNYSAYVNVYGTDNVISLTASINFQNQEPYLQSITLSWNNQGTIRENDINLDQAQIEKINEKFNIDIFGVIEEYKSKLKVDEDDNTRFVVSDYKDDESIYLSESYGIDDEYFIYLALGQDIGDN
ncbi:zinc ribbon domain-containing protein [Massilimicrobiota timonensis]|jgi:hypothetical protein|uniref:zinc ribbon domain-containing protein n=1 Tax=Massilimicrobiota timonensis TaxID=1776392 RepID=UPI00101C9460|nr:zinc ribbon domain-containing protein [Massilimicrobiota timonensis]